ncbi:MAG: hypothetical protein IJ412_06870 [Oscillospiraceae bacterium]|nr:hypothetical protein [Oscillospiraceae bacterium]
MKLLSQIKAFFTICGKKAEMKVSAAEIKQGRVFLHPIDDPDNVYCIKATSVDIIIDPQRDLSEDDILVVPGKKSEEELAKEISAAGPAEERSGDMSHPLDEKNVAIQKQPPVE